MQLAIWNYAPAEFLVSGFTSGRVRSPFDIERRTIPECEQLLADGQVDVALVTTFSILKNPDAFDVVPAVALSTWSYPYARIVLKKGLEGPASTIAFHPTCEQEAFLARLVLKEHYRMEPAFVPKPEASLQELLLGEEDGALVVGADLPKHRPDVLGLDLGREWYELANYPMVWGFFAMRKGEATPAVIRAIRNNVRAAEEQRGIWVRAQETSAVLNEFYAEDLRVRFDDLAVASLTELKQYLFFYQLIDDMADVPFAFLDETEEEGDDRTPLL